MCPSWLKRIPLSVSRSNGHLAFQSFKFSLKTPCVTLLLILKYKYVLHGIKKVLLFHEYFLSTFSESFVLCSLNRMLREWYLQSSSDSQNPNLIQGKYIIRELPRWPRNFSLGIVFHLK